MRITVNISAFGPDAAQAVELQGRLEALLNEFGLSGQLQGPSYDQFASLYGSFTSSSTTKSTPAADNNEE